MRELQIVTPGDTIKPWWFHSRDQTVSEGASSLCEGLAGQSVVCEQAVCGQGTGVYLDCVHTGLEAKHPTHVWGLLLRESSYIFALLTVEVISSYLVREFGRCGSHYS